MENTGTCSKICNLKRRLKKTIFLQCKYLFKIFALKTKLNEILITFKM